MLNFGVAFAQALYPLVDKFSSYSPKVCNPHMVISALRKEVSAENQISTCKLEQEGSVNMQPFSPGSERQAKYKD